MTTRLLLDTHVLLWALSAPKKIPATARRAIEKSEVFVSAASIWEIAIKSTIGKIKANPNSVLNELPIAGFDLLAIDGIHAARTFELGGIHKDPFDRMLVAQAMCESMILLTNDDMLAGYGPVVRLI